MLMRRYPQVKPLRRTYFHAVPWLGLLTILGCGGGGVTRTHDVVPVSGVVTYKGSPVEGASVTFHPVDESKPSARAKTDAQGRFSAWTFEVGDGAVPSDHLVTINKVEIIAPTGDPDAPGYDPAKDVAPPPRYLVPEKYGNRTTSALKATVSDSGPNEFEFALAD
jgi:hypothetical protein